MIGAAGQIPHIKTKKKGMKRKMGVGYVNRLELSALVFLENILLFDHHGEKIQMQI